MNLYDFDYTSINALWLVATVALLSVIMSINNNIIAWKQINNKWKKNYNKKYTLFSVYFCKYICFFQRYIV